MEFNKGVKVMCLLCISFPFCYAFRSFPFTLPDSTWCTPCNFTVRDDFHWDSIKHSVEGDCCAYKGAGFDEDPKFEYLVEEFQKKKHPQTYLLFLYFTNMKKFEKVYGVPYDFNVYVVPSNHTDYCIQLFVEGEGFRKPKNLTGVQSGILTTYKEGFEGENSFINHIMDEWRVVTPGCSLEKDDIKEAVARLSNITRLWKEGGQELINSEVKGKPSRFGPVITDAFKKRCYLSRSIVPIGLREAVKNCESKVCLLNDTNQPIAPPPVVTPCDTSNTTTSDGGVVESRTRRASPSDPKQHLINEFRHFVKENPSNEQFIEIRVSPLPGGRSYPFGSMKIVVFTAYTKKIVRVVVLKYRVIPANGFFYVSSKASNDAKFHVATDFEEEIWLPSGENEPLAMVLLEKLNTKAKDWENLDLRRVLGKHYKTKMLTEEDFILMKSLIIDGLIYGISRNYPIPKEVSELFPRTFQTCNCVLPMIFATSNTEHVSINLCMDDNDSSSFKHEFFKYGQPTPGGQNICEDSREYLCPKNDGSEILSPSTSLRCLPAGDPAIGILKANIDAEIAYIQGRYNSSYTNKYYPVEKFEAEISQTIQDNFDRRMIYEIPPYEFIPEGLKSDDTDDNTYIKKIRCTLCYKRLTRCRSSMSSQHRSTKLANAYQVPTARGKFRTRLVEHLGTATHLSSILYEVQKDRNVYTVDDEQRWISNPNSGNQQLANVIDVTYTILHTNTAPTNAPRWYALLRKIKANVGETMHSKQTGFRIINLIADTGTNDILEYLVAKDEPFTLILDGSADKLNNHYVLVYMQGLEGGVTSSYLIFMLKLQKRFTADSYLEALVEAVEKCGPDFLAYFRKRIVAIATDSAKVMEKFHIDLSAWVERKSFDGEPLKLVSIFCLAHRLQLATRSAFKPSHADKTIPATSPVYYFSYLEKWLQSSYTYFKWSGRRIAIFRDVIIVEQLPHVELKELHTERWISSEYSTVKNFVTAWPTSRISLQRIKDDRTIDAKSKIGIDEMQEQFRDKTALITLHFLWDFVAAFKVWSEHLQLLSGVLIDQYKYFETLQSSLTTLEAYEGKVLIKFLDECMCDDDRELLTIEDYANCEIIIWNNHQFEATKLDAPTFREASQALITLVRERLMKYIPQQMLASIHSLNPSRFPPNIEVLRNQYPVITPEESKPIYAEADIRELARMIGMNPEPLIKDWADLVESMLLSKAWIINRDIADANLFWAAILKDDVKWTDNTKLFIKSLKVLAPGSVACETGFSVFNEVKAKRRSKISDRHLESILKILINGPESIDKFDSYRYAERWILAGRQKPKVSNEDDGVEATSCTGVNTDPLLEEKDSDETAEQIECDPNNDFDITEDEGIEETEDDTTFNLPVEGNALSYADSVTEQGKIKDPKKGIKDVSRFRSRIM